MPRRALAALVAVAVVLLTGAPVAAARARFHYVPAANGAPMQLVPFAPGAPGERISMFGRSPYTSPPPRATFLVTFRHPVTCCTVIVPLGLPPDVPTVEHRTNRIIYNYGSYTVEVAFLADGSVDVIYNNGLMRDI